MDDTIAYKQEGNNEEDLLFDEAADEFPFDDCSDNFSDHPVSVHSPSASLRRRRYHSYDDSTEKKLSFSKKLMEMDKDKNKNSNNNIENLKSMPLDLTKGSQKSSVSEENKEFSTVMNDDSVIAGDDRSCLNKENKKNSTVMNGNTVITGDLNDDHSCLNEDSIITDVNNEGIDSLEIAESNLSGIDEENKEISTVMNGNNDRSRLNEDSITRDVKSDAIDNLRGSEDSSSNILFDIASLVIKAVRFQVNMLITVVSLMIKLFTFPVWTIYSAYMFVMDPLQLMRRGKKYVMHKTMNFVSEWLKEHRYVWRLGLKLGWGCLWSVYVCVILVGLLVLAFIMGGILMRIMVEEPIRMTEHLNFDYTAKSPVAYVPVIRSPGVICGVDSKDQVEVGGMVDGVRVIPHNHQLRATVSLTLPESDYNRNLGIFQVRVDFLTANGKVLASSRRPCMLQFKSHPIRLLSSFLKAAPLVTGYTLESQKLMVDLKGFKEGLIPTACLRVTIEQRAEFHPGGGIPELYAASLTLKSELPFLKRMLWYWKTTLFVWVSLTLFAMEFLFALICCKPLIIPRIRLRHDSNNRTGSQNNPPIER